MRVILKTLGAIVGTFHGLVGLLGLVLHRTGPEHWSMLVTSLAFVSTPAALVAGVWGDVVDVHADVLARVPGTLGADRVVGALRADPYHAAAELDVGVVDHAVRALHARRPDLAEPERALQERQRRADVLIWNGFAGQDPSPRGQRRGLGASIAVEVFIGRFWC
jgi:hypothetical protein